MIARAPVHVAYMEAIMPPEGAALRKQMYALKALDEGRATPEDHTPPFPRTMSMSPFPTRGSWQYLIVEFERVFGEGIEFVKGCRTSFLFFLDNKYPPLPFPI